MKNIIHKKHFGFLLCMAGTVSMVCANERHSGDVLDIFHNPFSGNGYVDAGWDNKYVSEGRDNLAGDSLITSSVEFSWKKLAAGVWYGSSPDQNYNELQLSLGVTHTIDDFNFYLAYTHLRTPFDHGYDNEIGTGFSWSGLPAEFEFAADAYYSFAAKGTFFELGLNREFEINDALSISVAGVLGINEGYISDGHDGWNHFNLKSELHYQLNDALELYAHAGYSWAIDRDVNLEGDALLTNLFHAGLGLQWSF